MSYTYKLKEESAGRVFINTVTNDDGTITSQVELNSPHLELVNSAQPAPNHFTGVAPQSEQPMQATAPQSEQTMNKTEENQ